LKYLAKTQNDTEPGIRTNTTVCIGKIAPHLGANTRAKVLIAAFGRALRDPFVHARTAALQSLSSSVEYFSETDIANNIIAGLGPSLIDKEKYVIYHSPIVLH
jgi:SCY1-like protein 1